MSEYISYSKIYSIKATNHFHLMLWRGLFLSKERLFGTVNFLKFIQMILHIYTTSINDGHDNAIQVQHQFYRISVLPQRIR